MATSLFYLLLFIKFSAFSTSELVKKKKVIQFLSTFRLAWHLCSCGSNDTGSLIRYHITSSREPRNRIVKYVAIAAPKFLRKKRELKWCKNIFPQALRLIGLWKSFPLHAQITIRSRVILIYRVIDGISHIRVGQPRTC